MQRPTMRAFLVTRFASLFTALALGLGVGDVYAGGAATFDEGLSQAAARGVPLLVDFYATWCGPCKAFDAAVKSDADIQATIEGVELFKIDAEKGAGIQLAQRFKVVGYPTYVLLNASGAVIARWMGYLKPDFLQTLGRALADPTTVEEKQTRFKHTPSENDALALALYHSGLNERPAAIEFYRQAQALRQDAATDYRFAVVELTAFGYQRDEMGLEEVTSAAEDLLADEPHSPLPMLQLASTMTAVGRKAAKQEIALPYLRAAMRASAGSADPAVIELRKHVRVDHALVVEKDGERAAGYVRDNMPQGWLEDADQLNSFAWWCFENRVNLEEAEQLARKGIDIAPAGSQKAMILDTMAEICNVRGSCRDSVHFIELAIQEDPKSEHYPKQLVRFQELVAADGGATRKRN